MQRIENDNDDLSQQPVLAEKKHVDLTPNYSSKKMHYRVTVKKLRSLRFAADSALNDLKNENFFISPPKDKDASPENQFNQDKHRGYYFAGKKLSEVPLTADVPAWSSDTTQNMDRLTTLFGKDAAQHIVAGHSQLPTYLFTRVVASYLAAVDDQLIITPNHQRVNFSKKPNGEIYQEIIISEFVIKDPNKSDNNGIVGYLPGPARIAYRLEKEGDNVGYRLQYIESNNKDILNMFCNRSLSSKELRQRYCQHPNYVKARCKLENTIAEHNKPHNAALIKSSIDVLHASINAFNDKSVPEHIITNVLNNTSTLLESPTIANSISYQHHAQAISKRPWGKVLAASMLVLASTALITASTAIALVSFGALAPVSILGFTLAASALVGGIAVGAGTLGIATTAGGAALFAKDIKKPRSKLTDEMTSLAKQAKSRG